MCLTQRYYFVSLLFRYTSPVSPYLPKMDITDMHPFQYMKYLDDVDNDAVYVLTSWQEITEAEYDLFKKLSL